ncbi:hypothetical protein YW5DRAFT_04403 [Streptomyces sp. Ncost-T6T-1]|uniref:hypothetical protein n=1 Tax=Streptomyces sp. Ncost-T6T-1 TaxID=1100828 RepID=UPI0008057039|nr:hypothetical protein [Streptomyces sp. Ncost-T6T-1]SBU93519.1 hypothetical protein YW5DRAFT_04403 [Streptomyces sp. Ncost-T6T-1]
MISEPELVGEDGPGSSSDVVSGFDPEQGSGGGGRRRWHGALWGVAGALTASAVWAAAVFGYGLGGDGKPDARGYRVESDSCAAMELKELGRALGVPAAEPATELDGIEHPALHRIRCTVDFTTVVLRGPDGEEDSGWSTGYQASLTAELHKATDPRSVFEAGSTVTDIDGTAVDRVERVPDLGDSAYLLITDDNTMRLSVVEGGAVMTLTLSTWISYNGEGGDGEEMPDAPEEPELLAYRGHLISDMRDVMKALRTG